MLRSGQFKLKRINDTRWSAGADAIIAVESNFLVIKESLNKISNDPNENPLAKLKASNWFKNFKDYETALLLILWNKLLQRINATNKTLQKQDCNLQIGVSNLKSLFEFILAVRNSTDNEFENMEIGASLLAGNTDYKSSKGRKKNRKLQFDENRNNNLIKWLEFFGRILARLIPLITGRKIENGAYNLLLEPFYYCYPLWY